MGITFEAPPPGTPTKGKNKSYRKLFEAIKLANGAWVAVDADEIGGNNDAEKRGRLRIASDWHHVSTEVAIANGKVYVRSVAAPVEVAHG